MEYIPAKHLVLRNKSTAWFGSDYTMNIYRGCNHGCIYCDSMSECYGIDDFGTVRTKQNALAIIGDDLRRKVRKGIVATGSMSDPYNSFERELNLTANALQLLDAYQFGIAIATKSDLITRDIPALQMIKTHSPVLCKLTVTTMDAALAAKIEPGAPSPQRRMAAVKKLADAGIFTGVLLMPVLPFLQDSEENVLAVTRAAAEAGAKFVYPAFGVTTRDRQREAYLTKLDQLFPQQQYRQKYEKSFPNRYQCTSSHAKRLWSVFSAACRDFGLLCDMRHITSAYKRGYGDLQMSFFE